MWTIGRSKRARLISEGHNGVAKVQCVSSKEKENSGILEKYLGERIFKRISEVQGHLKQGNKEKAEQLDKIAELEAQLRVEAEEKVEYLKTIAEVHGKLAEAHQETAEQLKNTWKLDAKLLAVEEEKFEYLKKISELEEELKESVKRTGKAVQVSKSEERRISPAAVRRSAHTPSYTSGSYPRRSRRSRSPDSERSRSPHRHMNAERSKSPDRYKSVDRSRSPDCYKSVERSRSPADRYKSVERSRSPDRYKSVKRSRSSDRHMSVERSRSPDSAGPISQEVQIPPTLTDRQNSVDRQTNNSWTDDSY